MSIEHIKTLLLRDLNTLEDEIAQYKTDNDLWLILPGTANPGGNLALHLIGNLRHFIGSVLGKTGYSRNREAEFTSTGMTKNEIIEMIHISFTEIKNTLDQLSDRDLKHDFPEAFRGTVHSSHFMLLHLITHFNYHLGQLNYHRRIVSNQQRES
jgi:hypothetical protein